MPPPYHDLATSQPNAKLFDLPPLAMDAKGLARDFQHYYAHTLGRDRDSRSTYYFYRALAVVMRDRLMERWKKTRQAHDAADCKRTYYLSLEFLMGRALCNAMLNLGLANETEKGLFALGVKLEELSANEPDAGLGNGGLGRLAACFLDSCATLQLPVKGYGLRYEYGMFRQVLENGHQVEEPDHWMRDGNPWELERPEYTQRIHFYGHTEQYKDEHGKTKVRWVDTHDVLAVPYDTPIPGYANNSINTLRLWKSAATDEFDLGEFNAGSYPESVAAKNNAEHITMVLYPNDASECGKELRLRQQYFLASASIKDVLREWIRLHGRDFSQFAAKNCFQLNDTHPAVSVAELMRQLMDEHGLELGGGLGDHPPNHGLHQPHPAPGGPGALAGATVRAAPAAHPGDHLRDQRAFPERGLRPLARRHGPAAAHVPDRRGRRAADPHGLPGHRRQLLRQRGGGAALQAAQGGAVPRLLRAVAEEVQQQDQRGHAAPLAGPVQPRSTRAAQRAHRHRLGA